MSIYEKVGLLDEVLASPEKILNWCPSAVRFDRNSLFPPSQLSEHFYGNKSQPKEVPPNFKLLIDQYNALVQCVTMRKRYHEEFA